MSKYNSGSEIPTVSVPAPPKKCGCGQEVDILSITVYDDMGQTHTGYFSKFGYRKSHGTGKSTLHMKGDYTYAHWNGFCATCHENPTDWRRKLLKSHFISLGIKQEGGQWKDSCMRYLKTCKRIGEI